VKIGHESPDAANGCGLGQWRFRCHSGHRAGKWERLTLVTRLIESTTHRFVEPEFAQLIALLTAWRQEIDSEPFAHEDDWATVDSPAFDVVFGLPGQAHVDGAQGMP
jgi:hypothetical protein